MACWFCTFGADMKFVTLYMRQRCNHAVRYTAVFHNCKLLFNTAFVGNGSGEHLSFQHRH